MISARARVGPVAGALFAALLALVLIPLATLETWVGLAPPAPGEVASYTVRRPPGPVPHVPQAGTVIVARGEVLSAERAILLGTRPLAPPTSTVVGLAVSFFLIGLLLCAYLRTTQRGRLARVQLTLLGLIVLFAAAGKAALLLTSLSWLLAPTAAGGMLAAVTVDRYAGLGLAVALGLVAAALLPFDPAVAIVLSTQGVAAVLALGRPRKRRDFVLAGAVGGLAAAATTLGLAALADAHIAAEELADPLRSGVLAALLGGLVSAPLAFLLRAPIERLAGAIPRARLVELSDLENPLLKKIAGEAPGTWQHSLAMANMAEICANAIGANALLVRVGAYYHDLGKALQPPYYIENLATGQTSPHDELAPETSADAIFSHVTEGVRLGRAQGLPTGIIEFMHMHHGDGLLEYFWSKCLEQGNPRGLREADFRYPGVKPQSRETAILAICDAVEAASRSLQKPDARAIDTIVQRIVYGKLHNGQLDESGLTVADLRRLANTLCDTLKHAHHVRIEYPWQREERALATTASLARPEAAASNGGGGNGAGPTGATPVGAAPDGAGEPAVRRPAAPASGSFVLDSADAPRPKAKR